jgi:hypothetical protein
MPPGRAFKLCRFLRSAQLGETSKPCPPKQFCRASAAGSSHLLTTQAAPPTQTVLPAERTARASAAGSSRLLTSQATPPVPPSRAVARRRAPLPACNPRHFRSVPNVLAVTGRSPAAKVGALLPPGRRRRSRQRSDYCPVQLRKRGLSASTGLGFGPRKRPGDRKSLPQGSLGHKKEPGGRLANPRAARGAGPSRRGQQSGPRP